MRSAPWFSLPASLVLVAGSCAFNAQATPTDGGTSSSADTKSSTAAMETKADSGSAPSAPGAGFTLKDALKLEGLVHLHARNGVELPNPPFSLAGLAEGRKMSPELVKAWQTCLATELDSKLLEAWKAKLQNPDQAALPRHRYMIYHGLGMASQRRLLECYYTNVEKLSSAEVFALVPWVILGLRCGVSGTLIDVTDPKSWYEIGVLIDVPLECICKTSPGDAHLPMESNGNGGVNQKAFRQGFLFENPLTPEQDAAMERFMENYFQDNKITGGSAPGKVYRAMQEGRKLFERTNNITRTTAYGPQSRNELHQPSDLLGLQNEVGFFSRITDPEKAIRIVGLAITGRGRVMVGVEKPDDKPISFYEEQARNLAKTMNVPFYDLRIK